MQLDKVALGKRKAVHHWVKWYEDGREAITEKENLAFKQFQ
jgi:hypothetical protein